MTGATVESATVATDPLLSVEDLHVSFGRGNMTVQAVAGITFTLRRGETLGLVGESGCGKSTTGRAVVQVEKATSGKIRFGETELTALSRGDLRTLRTQVQMIFQDPISSLNPRRRIIDIVSEPLTIWKIGTKEERVAAAMYFRNNKEEANASRILEAVLKDNPAHPWAASVQIQMLVAANKLEEAKRVVSAALDSSPDKAKVPVAFFLLNAAVENSMPPVADSLKRALAAVEQGLSSQPASVELVQAKCRLLGLLGDQKGAIAFVDAKAKTDPKGPFTRVLLNLYREIRDYRAAERVAADLLKLSPNDGALAVSLVRLVASQSIEARGRGDRAAVDL